MSDTDFQNWLNDEVLAERMSADQRAELLDQKELFVANQDHIREAYRYQVVGYVKGQLVAGVTVQVVLNQARRKGGIVYFEPVGFDLF